MRSKDDFVALEGLSGEEATFESPDYPESNYTNMVLTWHFKSVERRQIHIEVLDMSVKIVKAQQFCNVDIDVLSVSSQTV